MESKTCGPPSTASRRWADLRRCFGAVAGAVVLGWGGAGLAQEPIRLATGDGYPPWIDDRRSDGGVALKLIRQLEREIGIAVEIHFVPWVRAEALAERGTVNGVFPYIRTPDREARFRFSRTMFTVEEAYWSVAGRPESEARTLEDLRQHRVCVPRGYAVPSSVAVADRQGLVLLTQPQSMNDCLRALIDGAAHVVVSNPQLIAAWLRSNPGRAGYPVRLGIPALQQTHHILWGSSGEVYRDLVDRALNRLDERGVIAAIEREALLP